MSNPLEVLFAHCWELAEADTEFAALVPIGNRVKYNSTTVLDVLKDRVQQSDLPEVVLSFDAVGVPVSYNSCASRVNCKLTWALSTGDFRLNYKLTPVLWRLIVITQKLVRNSGTLLYDGNPYIESVQPSTGVIGASDPEKNRGIAGWSAAISFEVNLIVPNSVIES